MIHLTLSTRPAPPAEAEYEALTALVAAMRAVGVEAERGAFVNLFVGLKSKPLTLLVGPERAGKVAVMRCLAEVLTGGDPLRAQFMPGHAWWAGQTGHVALYTHAQTRLNTFKLLALLEEAHAPENRQQVLLACLTRVSPAELLTFFSATAFQLQRGELMRLFGAHFTEPVPYPRNLLLAGTLDARCAHDFDAATWAMTNVVAWPVSGREQAHDVSRPAATGDYGRAFLASMVRTEVEARLKLRRVLHRSLAAIRPLTCLEAALQPAADHRWPALRAELLVYLANAFSRAGRGLFAERPQANVELALDWAVATRLVPVLSAPVGRTPAIHLALQRVCASRWPKATQALEALPVTFHKEQVLR